MKLQSQLQVTSQLVGRLVYVGVGWCFTLLIVTIAFTASVYHHTCYIHLSFNNPLLSLFELVLHHFTNTAILTSHITMLQRLYTLLRPISHVALSPRHLSYSSDLRFHIYHHSLVPFACLRLQKPLDCHTVVASVMSQSHSLHFLRFLGFVVLHCTD